MNSKYIVIIGGYNFICGSSREHAPVFLGAARAKAVVAKSYARIFFRNCVGTVTIEPKEDGSSLLINHTTRK
ncbi:unnamed protein product [Arabis nemorensis]|uniref:Aconitase A/isopropylmalate dehydratase small subunit swivel domain-containing protein n=1 Tax=Arabis nemorensis TaxID=586526 RepID=A0A565B6I1_9BRAS|nr:unnamed protein product [Arabis nemorensis]